MKRKRKGQSRLLSLTLCLLAGIFPMTGITYAAETSCPNHQTHDAECGYVEAVEGAPCNHTCAVCCSEGGMNMDCPVYGAEGASSPTNG